MQLQLCRVLGCSGGAGTYVCFGGAASATPDQPMNNGHGAEQQQLRRQLIV